MNTLTRLAIIIILSLIIFGGSALSLLMGIEVPAFNEGLFFVSALVVILLLSIFNDLSKGTLLKTKTTSSGQFIVNTTSIEGETYSLVLENDSLFLEGTKYIVLDVVHR